MQRLLAISLSMTLCCGCVTISSSSTSSDPVACEDDDESAIEVGSVGGCLLLTGLIGAAFLLDDDNDECDKCRGKCCCK